MKTRNLLATVLIVMASVTAKAQPMSYYAMCDNARFLTDRMAYTLGLTERLIDDLYMINYDYIYAVNDYLDDIAYGYHYDEYMAILAARDAAIRALLTPYQWTRFIGYDYYYRPIFFQNARWWFGVYDYFPRTTRFYYSVPRHYRNYYGGHYFASMRPVAGHIGPNRGYGPHAGRIGDGFRGNDHMRNGNYNRNHGGNYNGNRNGHNNRGYRFDNGNNGNRNNNGGNRNYGGSYNNNNGGNRNGGTHYNGRGNSNMNRGGGNNSSRSHFSSGANTRTTTVSEPRTVQISNRTSSSARSMGTATRSTGSYRSANTGSSRSSAGFSSTHSSSRAGSSHVSSSRSMSSRSAGSHAGSNGGGRSAGAGRR